MTPKSRGPKWVRCEALYQRQERSDSSGSTVLRTGRWREQLEYRIITSLNENYTVPRPNIHNKWDVAVLHKHSGGDALARSWHQRELASMTLEMLSTSKCCMSPFGDCGRSSCGFACSTSFPTTRHPRRKSGTRIVFVFVCCRTGRSSTLQPSYHPNTKLSSITRKIVMYS